MGYKPWRTLSVFLALGAFTVGCTNGPQKSTGLGANSQPVNKNGQLASQQQQQAFPQANGTQANFNIPPQKQSGLPQMPPVPNGQTTGIRPPNQPAPFVPTSGPGNQNLEQFQPLDKTGGQSFPPGGGMTPIGGGMSNPSNPVAPNTGFGSDRGQPQPISLPR
jgi:hypothetical protein